MDRFTLEDLQGFFSAFDVVRSLLMAVVVIAIGSCNVLTLLFAQFRMHRRALKVARQQRATRKKKGDLLAAKWAAADAKYEVPEAGASTRSVGGLELQLASATSPGSGLLGLGRSKPSLVHPAPAAQPPSPGSPPTRLIQTRISLPPPPAVRAAAGDASFSGGPSSSRVLSSWRTTSAAPGGGGGGARTGIAATIAAQQQRNANRSAPGAPVPGKSSPHLAARTVAASERARELCAKYMDTSTEKWPAYGEGE